MVSDREAALGDSRRDRFWRDERTVANYLDTSRQAIPLANEQLDATYRVIEAFGIPVRTVLDVGAGDGVAAEAIARAFPVERITLVDFSVPMLKRAMARFAGSSTLIDVIEADLSESAWVDEVPPGVDGYDIVVSRYAIHHLTDDRKRELYGEIHGCLKAGGLFVNIEHVASESTVYTEIFDQLIIEGLVATSDPPMGMAEATAAYHGRYDAETNILAPADVQCGWLRDTGFVDVDIVMKIFELAVIVARKPIE